MHVIIAEQVNNC